MNANFVRYFFFACSLTLTLFFLIYCNYCCAKTGRSSSWVLFRDCNHGSNKAKLKRLNTCWPISLCGGALHFTGNFHKLHDDSTSSPNDFSLFLSFSPSVLAEEHTKSQMKYIKTDIEKSIFVFDCPALSLSLKFYRSIFRCGCWLTTCRYFSTVWMKVMNTFSTSLRGTASLRFAFFRPSLGYLQIS